ncbi:hypothetical protein ASU80_20135 [Enterobacter hormaechei subsp. xiangfangensis]|nr:hypothetical protein ASV11_20900 [Enterobacter hormaechei subsp. xiangfangensis]KTJ63421.1 hypothetical protein ASU80_20135 [Enterobacter hormaechei subsp. xiangfangensis]
MAQKVKKQLKAFRIDGNEYCIIRFHSHAIAARREGAQELDEDFGSVECKRAPEFDSYAPLGKVPRKALVEVHGWWQECTYCSSHVSEDNADRVWSADDEQVYCSPLCMHSDAIREEADRSEKLKREAEEAEAIELTRAKFNGIENVVAYGRCHPLRVSFTFPGGIGRVTWVPGEPSVSVVPSDSAAWRMFMQTQQQEGIAEV